MILDTFKAVFWSFFGVRKWSAYEADSKRLNPVAVVIVGLITTIVFVLMIFGVVELVTR